MSSETEGEAGSLPEAGEPAPRRRTAGLKAAAAALGPKGRALRLARSEGGDNVTPLPPARRKAEGEEGTAPKPGAKAAAKAKAGVGVKAAAKLAAKGGVKAANLNPDQPGAEPSPAAPGAGPHGPGANGHGPIAHGPNAHGPNGQGQNGHGPNAHGPQGQHPQAPHPGAAAGMSAPRPAMAEGVPQGPGIQGPQILPPQGHPQPGLPPPGQPGKRTPRSQLAPEGQARPVHTVKGATMRSRHFWLIALFCLMVIAPAAVYGTYLYTVAVDQYESDVGFGSRTEQASNTFDILGVLGGGSAATTKDMDILNQFVTSQELVERIDKKLDLRKIYSRYPNDWWFSFDPKDPVEDLVDYWKKMVVVNYDSSTGLMAIQVYAFTPEDAQAIAQEVVEESTAIINELSKTSQDDTTRYSRETLSKAEDRYRNAQNLLADFRVKNHIVDPQLELNGASQIINGLVQQMAEAQINLDLLKGQVADNDPRIAQFNRRIEVIQKRISEETAKVGPVGDPNDPGYAALIRDYQNLEMEMEFAQKAYMAAQGAYDQAVSDAQQQTHYLATFLQPTIAQSSTAPDRPMNILLTALVGLLAWSSVTMIYYALRDRR